MKHTLVIPLAIVAGGIIVAAAVYFSVSPGHFASASHPALVRAIDGTDHILGNPSAPVKIVEYADFDCEFCKGFSTTLHEIVANEGAQGQVAWVYREFPLTEIHPNAMKHAEAAECAAQVGGNDAFWKFADLLFANQPADPNAYGSYAAQAGIGGDAFATCYQNASSTVDARITADRENALAIGARGTPYSLIIAPGQTPIVVTGAYTYDALKQLLDEALQSASSTSLSR